jgi:hypothetical protein
MRITGLARCSVYTPPLEKLISNKTLGPDKGWTLLSDDELADFCANAGKNLEHRGRSDYEHVCAAYSQWAFDAQDASYIRCVVFLHYNISAKLREIMGTPDPGNQVFVFSGAELLATYNRVKRDEGEAHVWRRVSHGEIAIDFCLTKSADLKANLEGRIVLSDFIPR